MKDRILRDIRNVFRLENENKAIKDIIVRYIRNHLENEERENYYKPVRVINFWSNNYIEQESKSNRNKRLSVEEYLIKIRLYLKDILNNLKTFDMQKNQLKIPNNFISFIDSDKEHVMHLKSNNIEIMINDEADKVHI